MHVKGLDYTSLQNTYASLRILSDLELLFYFDLSNHVMSELMLKTGLGLRNTFILCRLFSHLIFEPSIGKSLFRCYINIPGKKGNAPIAPFDRFFFWSKEYISLQKTGKLLGHGG